MLAFLFMSFPYKDYSTDPLAKYNLPNFRTTRKPTNIPTR